MKWTKDKPIKPCVVLCRNIQKRHGFPDWWDYYIARIDYVQNTEGCRLSLLDNDFDEYGTPDELNAEEYLILETIPERI